MGELPTVPYKLAIELFLPHLSETGKVRGGGALDSIFF